MQQSFLLCANEPQSLRRGGEGDVLDVAGFKAKPPRLVGSWVVRDEPCGTNRLRERMDWAFLFACRTLEVAGQLPPGQTSLAAGCCEQM